MKYNVKPVRYWFPARQEVNNIEFTVVSIARTHMQVLDQAFNARIGD